MAAVSANQSMLGENDNLLTERGAIFAPSKAALFMPVAVVAAGYAIFLGWMAATGRSESSVARLALIVLTVGVPVLVAHAFLRYFTIRIRPQAKSLLLFTGFPRSEPFEIPYLLVRGIRLKRGLAGRLIDSGTLVFDLATGQRVAVCDLSRPASVRAEIEDLIDRIDPLQMKHAGRDQAVTTNVSAR